MPIPFAISHIQYCVIQCVHVSTAIKSTMP
ncbi:unnamed protein product, partial [Rotaria sp. Silwood2]